LKKEKRNKMTKKYFITTLKLKKNKNILLIVFVKTRVNI